MYYAIILTPKARRQFRKLVAQDRQRIGTRIDELARDPRPAGCEKLQGHNTKYRIRIGNYRVVYEVDDDVVRVAVILIGHRRDIYRDLDKL